MELADSIAAGDQQASALGSIAAAISAEGDSQRAEILARSIGYVGERADALTAVAIRLAETGDHGPAGRSATEAETLARTLISKYHAERGRRLIAVALGRAGRRGDAEDMAGDIDDPFEHAMAVAELALITQEAGDHERARHLAGIATSLAGETSIQYYYDKEHADLAIWIAQVGEHADAETVASTITYNPEERVRALTGIAAAIGNGEHAQALVAEANDIARRIKSPQQKAEALSSIAAVATQVGDRHDGQELAAEATAVIRSITDQDLEWAQVLTDVAAKTGDMRLAAEAENIARGIENPVRRASMLGNMAKAMAQAGHSHDAAKLAAAAAETAGSIDKLPVGIIKSLAENVAEAGDSQHAAHLLTLALSAEQSSDLWWVAAISRYFPTDIGDALEIIAEAYGGPMWRLKIRPQ